MNVFLLNKKVVFYLYRMSGLHLKHQYVSNYTYTSRDISLGRTQLQSVKKIFNVCNV